MPAESAARSGAPSSTARDRSRDRAPVAREHARRSTRRRRPWRRSLPASPGPCAGRRPRRRGARDRLERVAQGAAVRALRAAARGRRAPRRASATIARFTCSRWSRWSKRGRRGRPARGRIAVRAPRRRAGALQQRELLGRDAVAPDLAAEGAAQPAPFPTARQARRRSPRTPGAASPFTAVATGTMQPVGAGPRAAPGTDRASGEFHRKCPKTASGAEPGGDRQTPARSGTAAARDTTYADRHPDQPRVEDVGVQAARDHAEEEPVQHARGLAAEHAHEVEDVLDDREPQTARRRRRRNRPSRRRSRRARSGRSARRRSPSASPRRTGR